MNTAPIIPANRFAKFDAYPCSLLVKKVRLTYCRIPATFDTNTSSLTLILLTATLLPTHLPRKRLQLHLIHKTLSAHPLTHPNLPHHNRHSLFAVINNQTALNRHLAFRLIYRGLLVKGSGKLVEATYI